MRGLRKGFARVVSAVLCCFMSLGMCLDGSWAAKAEQQAPNDQYTIDMEYLSDRQALRISQRLVYINRTDDVLGSVLFYAAGNMFRRESTLMYESDDLETVFPAGYSPGGLDVQDVLFNGEKASWGMQGRDETVMRVSCDIAPGESGVFEFEYYLLLTECGAFIGAGDNDVRLSAFYFIPGRYNDHYHEFDINQMLPHTRWLDPCKGDYDVTLTLPENYSVAASGEEMEKEVADGKAEWHIRANDVREIAVSFGKRFRIETAKTASGTEIRTFTNVRGNGVKDAAVQAVETLESWFGEYPVTQLDIVQSDYPLGTLNYPGVIWVSGSLMENGDEDELVKQIRYCAAQQYFGMSAYTAPVSDAWMSDAVCEYLSYMILEEAEGKNAFLKAINRDWVDALQLTIPGGLTVTSDAGLFDAYEYDVVVRARGAVVMHELRCAMGREEMIEGLGYFHDMGKDGHTLTEIEFAEAFNSVTGKDWESFLTDWVFNVGDYVNQEIEWFE